MPWGLTCYSEEPVVGEPALGWEHLQLRLGLVQGLHVARDETRLVPLGVLSSAGFRPTGQ